MFRRALLGLLLAAMPVAGRAAEPDPLVPPDLTRYLRWGPLRVRPNVTLSNVGYDDNIYDSPAVERVGDYTATVSPGVQGLVLFGHRAFLTLRETVDATLYLDSANHDLAYLNQRGDARLTVPFGSVGAYVDGAVHRINERPISDIVGRPQRNETRLGVGAIVRLGWRTHVEVGRTVLDRAYDNPVLPPDHDCRLGGCQDLARLNRAETGVEVRARYLLRGRTSLTLDGSTRRIAFDEPESRDRDADDRRLLPGVRFGEGGRLVGTARLGWGAIDAVDARHADYDGLLGDTSLTYRFGTGTTVQLEAERDARFAVFSDHQYYVYTGYEARVIHYITRSIGVEAATLRGHLDFSQSALERDRQDRIEHVEAGLRLRLFENDLGRRIEYTLRIRHRQRRSTEPGVEDSRTSGGFGVVLGY